MGYRQTTVVGREEPCMDCFLEDLSISKGSKQIYHQPVFLFLSFLTIVDPNNMVMEDDDILS